MKPDKNILATFLEFKELDAQRTGEGLSVIELSRWDTLRARLEQRFGKGGERPAGDERRESLRVPTHLRCSFDSMGSFRDQRISNLSRGGVFINTPRPLPLGVKMVLQIQLEDTEEELEVEGEVVSNNVGPELSLSAVGMGVRFTARGARKVKEIDELYEYQMEQALEEAAQS